jgi:hypothetical protein
MLPPLYNFELDKSHLTDEENKFFYALALNMHTFLLLCAVGAKGKFIFL